MQNKLFNIEEYVLNNKLIIVTMDNEKEIHINREDFEKWLESSGRLEFSHFVSGSDGEPIEIEQVIPIWGYWEDWDAYQDLYDFIIIKQVADPFDLNDSLANILQDYSQE